ncbi:hypothetical protein BJ878DRAFT_309636 [Calycina marina]|uniref:DUF7820 domain-containing protein n=1 Tax=Calycina marina TaxID=1763456 RepID=A0A9P7ZC60_9HELO|nr:hypothetical protein BJ878DRAFT_309636 [Calycina marina]
MGEGHRTSMGMDPRMSMQSNATNDDEYALAALGMSDGGYSPMGQTLLYNEVSAQAREPATNPVPPPRPSSTSKPRCDSFALRHDGEMGQRPLTTMDTGPFADPLPTGVDRSFSVSSTFIVRPESVYQGPSAPSHPYQMYPQQARLARTASVATASTAQASESSYGASTPTMVHPYRGDPQTAVLEAETAQSIPTESVPVGFPGRANNYQRRLGPEGEEIGGLIGPDGHTEELPPYTKYADDVFARKTRLNAQMKVVAVVPGAGGIGLATRNPEFASQEYLSSPRSQRSIASSISSEPQPATPVSEVTQEKPQLKKWQQVARRKVCGIIPIWVFVLIGICFVVFGIILAIVFAVVLKHPSNKENYHPNNAISVGEQQQVTPTTTAVVTSTLDAVPFQTLPTGSLAIPTGAYILPISVPAVAPAGCVADTSQSVAWGCQVQAFLDYEVTINSLPDNSPLSNNEIDLTFNRQGSNIPYGSQPPVLKTPQVMRLANDSQNPERGPAWFFQTFYDKVVVLPESALTATTLTERDLMHANHQMRDIESRGSGPSSVFGRKSTIQSGEKPWFCYWNSTLLEAFIYIKQSSQAATQASADSYPTAATSERRSHASATTVSTTVTSGTTTYISSMPTQSGSFEDTQDILPRYPKQVKLEERRVPQTSTVAPYCVQFITNSDGSYEPILNALGNPTTITLQEYDPVAKSTMDARDVFGSLNSRATDSECGCEWVVN